MKHVLSSLGTAAFILLACYSCYENDESHTHLSKREAFGDKYNRVTHQSDSSSRDNFPLDTVVYVTGVEFDNGYDWRSDSLYGHASGRIFMLRNGERTMEIAAGGNAHASLDPDKHHMVEGHIFTEFCNASGTCICKDGQELFSYPEKETLRGLVIEGEDVFTLGQSIEGQGFALRKNGEVLFSKKDGFVSGQMLDYPEYPTGALYMDCGHMYFCYWRAETAGSSRKAWYIVEDERETQFNTVADGFFNIRVEEGQVHAERLTVKQSIQNFYSDDCAVIAYQDGTLMIDAPCLDRAVFTKETYYYFSFRNSCSCGNTLYIALTPHEKGKAPFIWKNGEVYETDINGFLTGISVSVIPRKNS